MKNSLLQRAAQFYQNQRQKQLWHRVVSGMACVVVFCTAYALILPAITLEKDNPQLEAEETSAVLGDALTLHVIAQPDSDAESTVFYLAVRQDNAGLYEKALSEAFDQENTAYIKDDNGEEIALHREYNADGTVGYWFSLPASEETTTLTLPWVNGIGQMVPMEIEEELPEEIPAVPGEAPEIQGGTPELPEEIPAAPGEDPETEGGTSELPEEKPAASGEAPETQGDTPELPEETPAAPDETSATEGDTPKLPDETPTDQDETIVTPEEPQSADEGSAAPTETTDDGSALEETKPSEEEDSGSMDEQGTTEPAESDSDSGNSEEETLESTLIHFSGGAESDEDGTSYYEEDTEDVFFVFEEGDLDAEGSVIITAGSGETLEKARQAAARNDEGMITLSWLLQLPEEVKSNEPVYICGKEEHCHDENCYDAEGNLICGMEEHVHTDACCAVEMENGHGALYGSLSALPDGAVLIPAEQEEYEGAVPTYLFRYDDGTVKMTIQLTGETSVAETGTDAETDEALLTEEPTSEEAAEADPVRDTDGTGELVLAVIPQEEDSQAYCDALEYAAIHSDEEELYSVLAYEFCFFQDGMELDVSGCEVTVELSPKEATVEASISQEEEPALEEAPAVMSARMMAVIPETEAVDAPAAIQTVEEQDEAERTVEERMAETAIRISVLQDTDGEVTETDSALVAADEAAGTVVRFTLQSNRMAVTLSRTANPHFAVQYYAYIPRVRWKNENAGALSIIDTDNGGVNNGGNLPQNGETLSMKYLAMENSRVAMENVLTEVYQQRTCEYISAPNLTYFNSLYENGNYSLKEVWVLKAGGDPASTDQTDWEVYEPTIHFTNRAESVNGTTILIAEDTVIRLVYDITESEYQNDVNFYDYDITNGKIFSTEEDAKNQTNALKAINSGGTYYVKTDNSTGSDQQGINSPGNYSGSGTKLAFGNNNTRVALGVMKWGENEPNKFNEINRNTGGGGCTFGLASGMDGDGNVRFSNGIQAPALFGTGTAAGKTAHLGYGMNFQRQGDTYTLERVTNRSGAAVTGELNTFSETPYWDQRNYPGRMVYANEFWPLDSAYDYHNGYVQGHDPKTGPDKSGDGTHIYAVGSGGTEHYPASDNGVPHNNYFGMNLAVQFKLVEDYVGPLEYLFFGDDDMWVFLDGGLICDIGGVHSSVGEYVNLWDYIEKGTAGTHTLSFFYTERGASGSSCYMQFTLPSVSSVTPEQNTGELRVEKKVVGPYEDVDYEYSFDIRLTDSNGNSLPDDYSYSKYDAQGNYLLSDVIIFDGGSFTLKNGEYIIIKYLPYNTKYTITEVESPETCQTTVQVNAGRTEESRTAEGSIPSSGARQNVLYTNTTMYELPQTGGTGTLWYTLGGLCLTAGALLLLHRSKTRGKGGRANSC